VVIPQGFAKSPKDPMQLQLEAIPAGQHLETVSEFGQPPPASDAPQTDNVGRLSNREQTILKQLTQGASNKQIARELNIAEATVKVHVKSLLRKIHVSNRTQAAMWAIQSWRTTGVAVFLLSFVHDAAQLMW
jgi:DNA-binding NarL/FixJ family response regulator